jgi:hypothetical protein
MPKMMLIPGFESIFCSFQLFGKRIGWGTNRNRAPSSGYNISARRILSPKFLKSKRPREVI